MTIRAEETAENLHTARLRLPDRDFLGAYWCEGDFATASSATSQRSLRSAGCGPSSGWPTNWIELVRCYAVGGPIRAAGSCIRMADTTRSPRRALRGSNPAQDDREFETNTQACGAVR
jgi:hypothetical protein